MCASLFGRARLSVWFLCAGILVVQAVCLGGSEPSEASAIAKLEQTYGTVVRDESDPAHPVIGFDFGIYNEDPKFLEEIVRNLRTFKKLRSLGIRTRTVTEKGLSLLSGLPEVTAFDFQASKLSEGACLELRKRKNLKSLNLMRSHVAGNGREQLGDIAGLESLTLSTSGAPKKTLEALKKLVNMKSLTLQGWLERDIDLLRSYPELEYLDLSKHQMNLAGLINVVRS